jgi:hypothetical protein
MIIVTMHHLRDKILTDLSKAIETMVELTIEIIEEVTRTKERTLTKEGFSKDLETDLLTE